MLGISSAGVIKLTMAVLMALTAATNMALQMKGTSIFKSLLLEARQNLV
jgi:hypothetical protein